MQPQDSMQPLSMQEQLIAIEERLERMKAEVDTLQVEVMQPRQWYKDAAVIVSIIAVVFSIATATLSYWQVQAQDRRAARAELRGLIQRITALPKENADLFREFQDDPATINQLSSMVNTEYTILAQQALELSDRIPNDISAHEYQAIAQALMISALPAQVPFLLERGLQRSQDVTSMVALLRTYGNYLFLVGDAEGGREKYRQALAAAEEYAFINRAYVAYSNVVTQLAWASAEFNLGHCDETESLLQQLREQVASFPPGPMTETLAGQITEFQTTVQENPDACLTS